MDHRDLRGGEGVLALSSVGIEILMSDLYEGIALDEATSSLWPSTGATRLPIWAVPAPGGSFDYVVGAG